MKSKVLICATFFFVTYCFGEQTNYDSKDNEGSSNPVVASNNFKILEGTLDSQVKDQYLKMRADYSEKLKSEQSDWKKNALEVCRSDECIESAYISRILDMSLGRDIRVQKIHQDETENFKAQFLGELRRFSNFEIESCGTAIQINERNLPPWNHGAANSFGISCQLKNTKAKILMCDDFKVGKFNTAFPAYDDSYLNLARFVAEHCPPGG